MSQRTVTAEYIAKVDQFISNTLRAKAAVTGFGKEVAASSAKQRAAANDVAVSSAKAGAAVALGLGFAAKAAIDWETAWAGVTKTVDGSTSQMAELEGGLRDLATTLPATHQEIAAVAEAAGQLGVKRGDILGFTETMIAMGESTNLAAEDAATSMAQISNVMGTMEREGAPGIERLGSTIVALGNAGASTEADIVSMATRLTGAGKLIGATEADVLALANAMSSVGIEAQLGGGVMSRVMQNINSAVIAGSDEMEGFARISGMTAAEFSQAWNSDPVAAIDAFVRGLGGINESGGDAVAALSEVGIKGTENTSVLLRLSGASDILTDSLALGAQAWAENTALQDEASKRYATAASQLEIAKNNAKDAAIDFGSVLAPAIAEASGAVSEFSEFMADLPPGLQSGITLVGGFGAAAALATGGTIKLATSVLDMRDSINDLNVSSPRAGKALGALGKAAAVVGVAALASEMNDLVATMKIAEVDATQLARSLDGLSKSGQLEGGIADLFRDQGGWLQARENIVTVTEAVERFGVVANDATGAGFINDLERLSGNGAEAKFDKYVTQLDTALTQLVQSGNAEEAARQLDALLQNVDPENIDAVRAAFTGYNEALKQGASAASGAKGPLGELADTTSETGEAQAAATIDAEAYADSLKEVRNAIEALGGGLRAERAAVRDFAEAQKAAAEAAKGTSAEQAAALDEMAASALAVAAAQVDMGRGAGEVEATMGRSREAIIATAMSYGQSREFAEAYADAMGLIPEQVQTLVSQVGAETAAVEVKDLTEVIRNLDGKTVPIKEAGAQGAKKNVLELDGAIFGLKGKTVKVDEIGATASGDRVVRFQGKIYTLTGKTVSVGVTGTERAIAAVESVKATIRGLDGKTVTIRTRYVTEGKSTMGGLTRSGGGSVFGPGTSTSDSIPAWLSDGEFVHRTRAAQHWGYDVMHELNEMRLSAASLRKMARASGFAFAGGGTVGSRPAFANVRPAPAVTRPVIQVAAPAMPSLVGLRISGELGLDGRLEGVITAVDGFTRSADRHAAMSGG